MQIGYARVFPEEQTLATQQDAITQAGCERVFTDTVSGSQDERLGLSDALSHLRPGSPSSGGLTGGHPRARGAQAVRHPAHVLRPLRRWMSRPF
jgi:hypothetical protein